MLISRDGIIPVIYPLFFGHLPWIFHPLYKDRDKARIFGEMFTPWKLCEIGGNPLKSEIKTPIFRENKNTIWIYHQACQVPPFLVSETFGEYYRYSISRFILKIIVMFSSPLSSSSVSQAHNLELRTPPRMQSWQVGLGWGFWVAWTCNYSSHPGDEWLESWVGGRSNVLYTF